MLIKEYCLKEIDWYLKIYYALDTYYLSNILGDLESIGCDKKSLSTIENLISRKNTDFGFVFSNVSGKCSIVLIGLTSSLAKFKKIKKMASERLITHINADLNKKLDEIL